MGNVIIGSQKISHSLGKSFCCARWERGEGDETAFPLNGGYQVRRSNHVRLIRDQVDSEYGKVVFGAGRTSVSNDTVDIHIEPGCDKNLCCV